MTVRMIRRRTGAPAADFGPGLHPVLRRVYAARGLTHSDELALSLDRLLPVRTLEGLDAAVTVLLEHLDTGSRVLVVGDFDADGATSSALLVRGLKRLGFANVGYLVPNRFRYGYGLTPEIVALAAEQAPGLIVTVDNGISSHAGVLEAQRRQIDVLITDHHLPGTELPAARAIVNPNLVGATFASHALAGVGVAFYLLASLSRRLQERGAATASGWSPAELLDLVALGTVADLVPLDQNNRILVAQGLKRIRAGRCVPGITALLEQAKREPDGIVAQDLGFAVAPRLNAAGRLDDMSLGIECLLTNDIAVARQLAARLSELNDERREIEQRMQAEALEAVARLHLERQGILGALCLYDESWHQGVVGLVASRVKDRVHRPVVAFARAEDGTLRGSARSVTGVHIRDVLDAVAARYPGLLDRFGGHAMAAGLTLRHEHLDAFAAAFGAEVDRWLDPAALGIIDSDGELAPEEMTLATALELRAAGPWGQAFPEPAFDGEFELLDSRAVGDRHLKLRVRPVSSGESYEAMAFRYLDGTASELPAGRAQMAYRLDVNEYLGIRRLQLVVEHLARLPHGS
ncbi:MAG TPA: single-stranded-DNA-specific exonuclease RecJ [Steroidobacteraceae bacterium]|nr:single-stranded-DNA-specific exonuclease RecJ [Steroidobacteraceae bacterium]